VITETLATDDWIETLCTRSKGLGRWTDIEIQTVPTGKIENVSYYGVLRRGTNAQGAMCH